MAISVKVNKVRRIAATGRIYVQWADGVESEFESFQQAKDWAQSVDLSEEQALSLLRKLAVRYYLLRDPTGATPALIEGKTMTLDLSSNTPLVVS